MSLFRKDDRAALSAGLWTMSIIAMVMSLAALIAVVNDDGGGGGGSGAQTVTVSASEFRFDPSAVSVPEGGSLVLRNAGSAPHNLYVEGTEVKTADVQPGDQTTVDISSLAAGQYTFFCNIAGHRSAGMEGTLTIGSGGSGNGGSGGSGAGMSGDHSGMSADQLKAQDDSLNKTQAEGVTTYVSQLGKIIDNFNKTGKIDATLYEPNTSYGEAHAKNEAYKALFGPGILQPSSVQGNVKTFDVTASIIDWEVEPGKTVKAWAYNGQVPGPTIQASVGDVVRINFRNDLPQSSAIHLHGIQTTIDMDGVPFVTQDVVKPGKSFTYEFTADQVAVGMYHSHHHAENQVPNGLIGAVLIGNFNDNIQAATGKPEPDQRIEMILNDAGTIGLSLNGKSFPATAPIVAATGQWVQIDYHNEGMQMHPMHLHGLPQLVIGKDGFPTPVPYTVDTLDVAPGERYSVLIYADPKFAQGGEKTYLGLPIGVWAFHCHILNHAERESGMFGMVTTFIVVPREAIAA